MSENKTRHQAGNRAPLATGGNNGFLPGMTQPGGYINLEVRRRKQVDFDGLDRMLVEIFGTELVFCRKTGLTAPKADIQMAWRVLLVGRDLLQACGVPSFDPGFITSITRSPDSDKVNRIRALIPVIEYVPRTMIRDAYRIAGQVIAMLTDASTGADGRATFLRRVNDEFVSQSRKIMRCGESTVPVLQAAYERGIPARHLGGSIYRLGWGSRSRLLDRSSLESDAAVGAKLTQDKQICARVMRDAGLPAPAHLRVGSEEEALSAADKIGWPVVVKPPNRDRGEGITVGVGDSDSLRTAYGKAAEYSRSVLIEKQAPGVCHRLFVAGKKQILFAAKRLPKSVKGDGEHSVRQLIDQANAQEMQKAPWRRLKPFPVDELAVTCLAQAGFTLESVLPEGVYAPLRVIQSDADGGVSEDRTDHVHPENADIVRRAAALFGLDSAGVDLITEDISRPWFENGGIINEVNYASLLGGHRTSARTLGYPGKFLEPFFHHGGRLPVEAFVGGDGAMEVARERQQQLVDDGVACFATSHLITNRPDGSAMTMGGAGLFERTLQLTAHRDLEALVLVVQTDELLHTGCPLWGIGPVRVINTRLTEYDNPDTTLPDAVCRRVVSLLQGFSGSVEPVRGAPP